MQALKNHKRSRVKNYTIHIENQGEVKAFLMHLPAGTRRVKCVSVSAQSPLDRVQTNTLLQEDGFDLLQENGDSILIDD